MQGSFWAPQGRVKGPFGWGENQAEDWSEPGRHWENEWAGSVARRQCGSQKHASRCRCSAEGTEDVAGTRLCPGREERETKAKDVPAGAQFETGPGLGKRGGRNALKTSREPRNLPKSGRMITQETAVARTMPGRREEHEAKNEPVRNSGDQAGLGKRGGRANGLRASRKPTNKTCMECGRRGRACRIWGKCSARARPSLAMHC